MNILCLLRRSRLAGANRPNRLIGYHRLFEASNATPVQHGIQLPLDDGLGFAAFAFFKCFTDTKYRLKTSGQCCFKAVRHIFVGLSP